MDIGRESFYTPPEKITNTAAGAASTPTTPATPATLETPVQQMVRIKPNTISVRHGCTAVDTNGTVWGWGMQYDYFTKKSSNQLTPKKLMDNVMYYSGGAHGAAVKTDGTLWTWGENYCGQLGDGTSEERKGVRKIMDNVSSVCLSSSSAAAVQKDGSLWVWGNNYSGQLGFQGGNETGPAHLAQAKPVKAMDNVAAVEIDYFGSAALKKDGSVWIWGTGTEKINKNVLPGTTTAPKKIMDGAAALVNSCAAVKADGSLWLWGENQSGRLGNGTTQPSTTAVRVPDLTCVLEILPADGAQSK